MSTIRLPKGYRFAGVACGIKASEKPDVSLVVCDVPAVASGVYTQNQVVAAPVQICRQRTPSETIRAVVTNSGNANACTGQQGQTDALAMCQHVAGLLDSKPESVLLMSTGVIGHHLPMPKVTEGIQKAHDSLGDQEEDFLGAADAILTTDLSRKVASAEVSLDGQTIRIAAMAKGAGMINPNMATMLALIITDAKLTTKQASRFAKSVADATFNRVSVDGHTSTNDTQLLLANGASEVAITEANEQAFLEALISVTQPLAIALAADGEGAERIMNVQVSGAQSDEDAELIARTVGASPLVKTALTGCDPNWGRIVSAAGYAGPKIDPDRTCLTIEGHQLYHNGAPTAFDQATVSQAIKDQKQVDVQLIVGSGPGKSNHITSDLTTSYVRFNSEYTT